MYCTILFAAPPKLVNQKDCHGNFCDGAAVIIWNTASSINITVEYVGLGPFNITWLLNGSDLQCQRQHCHIDNTLTDKTVRISPYSLSPGCPSVALSPGCPSMALSPGCPSVALSPGCPSVALSPGCPSVALSPGHPSVHGFVPRPLFSARLCPQAALQWLCPQAALQWLCPQAALQWLCPQAALQWLCPQVALQWLCPQAALQWLCPQAALHSIIMHNSYREKSCGGNEPSLPPPSPQVVTLRRPYHYTDEGTYQVTVSNHYGWNASDIKVTIICKLISSRPIPMKASFLTAGYIPYIRTCIYGNVVLMLTLRKIYDIGLFRSLNLHI